MLPFVQSLANAAPLRAETLTSPIVSSYLSQETIQEIISSQLSQVTCLAFPSLEG